MTQTGDDLAAALLVILCVVVLLAVAAPFCDWLDDVLDDF